mmetsp:Transcript_40134/g.39716  ORF Transcript_40134/g.39716 Transcript_40134/m.39716 type:complete len:89 (-) Transcript_40134:182-448(-)
MRATTPREMNTRTLLAKLRRIWLEENKKIYEKDFEINSISTISLSNIAQAPKLSHCEKRIIEKANRKEVIFPTETEKSDSYNDLPLIK